MAASLIAAVLWKLCPQSREVEARPVSSPLLLWFLGAQEARGSVPSGLASLLFQRARVFQVSCDLFRLSALSVK